MQDFFGALEEILITSVMCVCFFLTDRRSDVIDMIIGVAEFVSSSSLILADICPLMLASGRQNVFFFVLHKEAKCLMTVF